MTDFKTRLKKLRNSKGLTQIELAQILNTSKSTISMYENGNRKPPLDVLEEITDFFNVDINYILGISDEEKISNTIKKTFDKDSFVQQFNELVDNFGRINYEIDEYKETGKVGKNLDKLVKRAAFKRLHTMGVSLDDFDVTQKYEDAYSKSLEFLSENYIELVEK